MFQGTWPRNIIIPLKRAEGTAVVCKPQIVLNKVEARFLCELCQDLIQRLQSTQLYSFDDVNESIHASWILFRVRYRSFIYNAPKCLLLQKTHTCWGNNQNNEIEVNLTSTRQMFTILHN
jgi:hypothetical protein